VNDGKGVKQLDACRGLEDAGVENASLPSHRGVAEAA
jgi:hypothetical protein